MKRDLTLAHRFVEYIPDQLEERVLYISIPFATAVHSCCSGCGREVVTPLSPTDWSLTFDGQTVSLHPSIGNWSFPCQSHYWIRRNRVVWAPRLAKPKIDGLRARDRAAKAEYFAQPADRSREVAEIEIPRAPWYERL